jgi:hypothetical protein
MVKGLEIHEGKGGLGCSSRTWDGRARGASLLRLMRMARALRVARLTKVIKVVREMNLIHVVIIIR